jgi:MFS transporter, PPP family, 3-phenylpropionic acid transporter
MRQEPTDARRGSSDLARFTLLFSVLYCSFGVASPFLPAFLLSRGISPEQIGLFLSLSQFVRVLSVPIAGRIADTLEARRDVLAICAVGSAIFAAAFLPANTAWILLIITLLQAAMLAPTASIADALALRSAAPKGGSPMRFEYGWVRGAGSAAFIVGSVVSGQAVAFLGFGTALAAQAVLLTVAAGTALLVPKNPSRFSPNVRTNRGLSELLLNRPFLWLILVAATVLGSHAMHDAFAMISWSAAGISSAAGAILWSGSVAAEVLIFFLIGPWLLSRISPQQAMMIAAFAAVLRWTVMGATANVLALALVEPLHGLTFALLHLACMRILVRVTPNELAATAQAIYAFGIAVSIGLLTLASGYLYAKFGSGGFFVMAGLATTSLPFIWCLSRSLRASERL